MLLFTMTKKNYVIGARLNNILFTVIDEVNISFVLTCTSRGGPVNKMLWLRDDKEVQNSNHFPILSDAGAGLYYSTLAINGTQIGEYSCKITNETNGTIMVEEYEVKGNVTVV